MNKRFATLLTCLGISVSTVGLCPEASQAAGQTSDRVPHAEAAVTAPGEPWKIADSVETAKILYKRAQTKTQAKDYQGAIADYDEVIRLVPDYDKPYVNRANLKDATGDKNGALEDYGKAIAINPQNPLAYYNRAVTLESMKKHDEAISDYSRTIQLKPDFVSAHKNRGFNYLMLKSLPNAVQDFQTASSLYKAAGNQEGYQQMQQMLKALGQ